MSKPAAKISPREQMARELRKQNMDFIIKEIENDFKAEKKPDRKKNIAACLAEAKKKGIYISGDDTIYAVDREACMVKNAEYRKIWATLDVQSKKLVYCRVSLHSRTHSKSMHQWWLISFVQCSAA